VNAGVKTIGIDYLSIEEYESPDSSVHKILLSNNIVIIEGLKLSNVTPGVYEIAALPLKIKGCDGSPARVVLIDNCCQQER
jgi:arylformamidase